VMRTGVVLRSARRGRRKTPTRAAPRGVVLSLELVQLAESPANTMTKSQVAIAKPQVAYDRSRWLSSCLLRGGSAALRFCCAALDVQWR